MATKMAFLTAFLVCLCWPVTAQTAGVIEGAVIDGDTGQGIPGARVRLDFEQDGPWFTFTDGAGHFRFAGLTAGKRYSLAARQIGFMGPGDGPTSTGGWGPSIQPGQTQRMRIELIRYAVIAGTVTDSSGAPVCIAEVTVMRKVPLEERLMQTPLRRLADGKNRLEMVTHTYTDQRGAYRVARLHPGTYYVVAESRSSDDQRTERATYYGGAIDFSGAKPIEAAAGRTIANINIEILKQAGVRVSGQIVKPASPEGGASSEGVFTSVSLQPLSGESGSISGPYATVKGDRFEIKDVLPGKYALTAVTRERYGRPEANRGFAASIQTIEVGQTDLSGLTVAPQPPHDLAGTVRFDQGCHPGSVRLSVRSLDPATAAVNSDGSFVLKNLLPSRYWLDASVQGDSFATLGTLRLGGRESQAGFLMSGEDYGPLLVEIVCPRGSVSGEVRDASGAPARNAMVVLASALMPGYRQFARVDREGGRFDITVRPGIYDVYVCSGPNTDPRYPDCQKTTGPLTVKDGSNSRLVLTLPAAPRKEGPQ